MTIKKESPYKDKNGIVIRDLDICRSWHAKEYSDDEEYWRYEYVRFLNNEWLLLPLGIDIFKLKDVPYQLSELHHELEVIPKEKVPHFN